MNPEGRSLKSSKIMRMAINRINPNFDRDLRARQKGGNVDLNRQQAFGKVVKKR